MDPIPCFMVEKIREVTETFADRTMIRPVFRKLYSSEEWVSGDLPVGAMYFADWLKKLYGPSPSPDGEYLIVRVPACADGAGFSDWIVEYPLKPWQRTGDPPNFSVTPSIFVSPNGNPPGWHGFLTNGKLVSV